MPQESGADQAPGSLGELARLSSYENVASIRVRDEIPRDPEGDVERLERLRSLGYIGN